MSSLLRLDKYLADAGTMTRSECSKSIRRGEVSVDGVVIKKPEYHLDPETSRVTFRGQIMERVTYRYLMMHKPAGTTCTTDGDRRSVMLLIPEDLRHHDMFPCGRLDLDTEGLLLITDDGPMAHELLSPRHHVTKRYEFRLEKKLEASEAERLEKGIPMDGKITKPATIRMTGDAEGTIDLVEGKYHQIKRMMEYAGNRITYLKRVSFGPLWLDDHLKPGECRPLSEKEREALKDTVKNHGKGSEI